MFGDQTERGPSFGTDAGRAPVPVPPGPALHHAATEAGLQWVRARRRLWWIVAASAVVATVAVGVAALGRSDDIAALAAVVGAVAVAATWMAFRTEVRVRRVVRTLTEAPWVRRTGRLSSYRRYVHARRRSVDVPVLALETLGEHPAAVVLLSVLHWEDDPPASGPVEVWVAGAADERAVLSRPGGADLVLVRPPWSDARREELRDQILPRRERPEVW